MTEQAKRKHVTYGDFAYGYLPGDAPQSLDSAIEILERVQEKLKAEGHDSYEAVFKVRALFRRHCNTPVVM